MGEEVEDSGNLVGYQKSPGVEVPVVIAQAARRALLGGGGEQRLSAALRRIGPVSLVALLVTLVLLLSNGKTISFADAVCDGSGTAKGNEGTIEASFFAASALRRPFSDIA